MLELGSEQPLCLHLVGVVDQYSKRRGLIRMPAEC